VPFVQPKVPLGNAGSHRQDTYDIAAYFTA